MWCADYFHHKGNVYLVMLDHFLGWIDVVQTSAGSNQSGTSGLVQALRNLFMDRGVPIKLVSDWGMRVQELLEMRGSCHRLLSALR